MFKSRRSPWDGSPPLASPNLLTNPDTASTTLIGRVNVLLPGLKAGQPEAYNQLHSLVADRLFRSAFRILWNRQDAEDAVQEAFLELIRAGCPPVDGRSLQAWLFTSVRFNCADLVRSRRRHPASPKANVPDSVVVDKYWLGVDPELEAALAKLTDMQRLVIQLKYVEALDGQAIADVVGTNRAAVYAVAARAERSLERELSYQTDTSAGVTGGELW